MILKDKEATEARRFEHAKSKVMKDGREILCGQDWKDRVEELRQRSGGRCEQQIKGVIATRCRSEAADPHHIVRRSKLRDDRLSNLQALCRLHHDLLDERKPHWTERKKADAEA